MKKIFTFLFLVAFGATSIQAQAIGDYGSVATGNWSAPATWKTWDGAAFATTTATAPDGTQNVFIQPGFTVTNTALVTFTKTLTLNGGTLSNATAANFVIGNTAATPAKIIVAAATGAGTSGFTSNMATGASTTTELTINANCTSGAEFTINEWF